MARYRPLYKTFWKDDDVQEFSPNHKLLFIYLTTNEAVTESGIYHITPRTIAHETGLDTEWIKEQLTKGFTRNILNDPPNRLIFIRKIRKYNTGGSPKLIDKAILTDYNLSSYSPLWQDFLLEYPVYKPLLNGCVTVDEPLETIPATTPELPETPPDDSKSTFEEYVESLKAESDYKSINFDEELKKFNLYWGEGKRKLKRPKLALRNWMNNALKYDKEKENGTHQGSNKTSRNAEGNTGRDKFVTGKYGKVVKR
ncbi:hypothetical protein LCGC14_2008350 [marine sediment metagenome]|uniref:Uncharacterized protein n=1 Tax=marine sediment metagenome TaxID=412755 RepID=A0A0F9F106_9ZZZZ